MIYFGTEITASVEGVVEAQFECECCGHQQVCSVEGRGTGQAANRYFLDGNAGNRADAKAQRELQKAIAHAFDLVTCPRCGKRSQTAMRRYWVKLGATVLAIIALAVGIRVLSEVVNHGHNELLEFMTWLLVAVLPLVLGWELWKNWFTVDSRVRFHAEP